MEETNEIKNKILRIFNEKVKGRKAETSNSHINHDGKEGHWLEKRMGLCHNSKNAPDLFGFEMKNGSRGKITFGDWSASFYIFKCRNNPDSEISRSQFLKMFGKPNAEKNNRLSWSGDPCPKIGGFNSFGQKLIVQTDGSIWAIYNYEQDSRDNKEELIPLKLRGAEVTLAKWDCEWIKSKLEKKFNQRGWFKCNKDKEGYYTSISFGNPIKYDLWLGFVRSGEVFFDSGMYNGNLRYYSQWRAGTGLWESLIVD